MTGVSSKLAGQSQPMSLRFFFFYGVSLFLCLVFAALWQQVLRHMSLTFAFLNKPVTVIYSLLWSSLIFGEKITPRMMAGAAVILAGIMIGVSDREKEN